MCCVVGQCGLELVTNPRKGDMTGPRRHLEQENMGVGVPASCHGANSRDFSVEMGSGIETQLVSKKVKSAFF